MNIYIGADHRAYDFSLDLITALRAKGYVVKNAWEGRSDPQDDHPDVVAAVVKDFEKDAHSDKIGVVLCGSGVGVSISANRYPGIYCVLGHELDQVTHARIWDHANFLALGSEYTTPSDAVKYVEAMVEKKPGNEERMLRRIYKIDLLASTK